MEDKKYGPVDLKGVPLDEVPYLIDLHPDADVPAGQLVEIDYSFGVRNFVCTHIGFTSSRVGFPAAGQQFRVGVFDIGTSSAWQPHRWNITALIGTNPGTSDKSAFELPVPWKFHAGTAVRISFESIGTLPCLPTLLLVGYLSDMGR